MNKGVQIEVLSYDEFIEFIKSIFKSSDYDIDKQYRIPNEMDNSPEAIAYRRIESIANSESIKVNWAIAIKCVTEDVNTISNFITSN